MKAFKLILLLVFATAVANAQTLPKIQQGSVKAPADIKIDGKAAEWGNTFKAYSTTGRVFYTLANDENNLYLIARMESERGNFKALIGGITLTVKPVKGTKSEQEAIAVSFPEGKGQDTELIIDILHMAEGYKKDQRKTDSIKHAVNQVTVRAFKQIVVAGIKGVSERSIPIYNNLGLQAACMFNDELQYVYELALPLKYLNGLIDGARKIQYNIKVNGTSVPKPGKDGLMFSNPAALDQESQYSLYSTDFNGEYILAK